MRFFLACLCHRLQPQKQALPLPCMFEGLYATSLAGVCFSAFATSPLSNTFLPFTLWKHRQRLLVLRVKRYIFKKHAAHQIKTTLHCMGYA